jgi:hypothetical protein
MIAYCRTAHLNTRMMHWNTCMPVQRLGKTCAYTHIPDSLHESQWSSSDTAPSPARFTSAARTVNEDYVQEKSARACTQATRQRPRVEKR